MRAATLRGPRGFFLRSLRIIVVSAREFSLDQCSLRASALTFYSLLSIVPVLAMAFGIAKGFGLDAFLREKLLENTQGQQEVFTRLIEFSENLLQNTHGGLIAGIGVAFLFWTVIKVLGNIEQSFNDIWGIKKQRNLNQKFTDYLSLMLILPLLFIVASSSTVFVVTQVTNITGKVYFLGPVFLMSLRILPYAVFSGLLTYLYIFMPNGKINFLSALLGGVVAGTGYQIVQWGYIHFQVGISQAGAVYGSFAALPLFLMWLQLSWLIVLYGAELAFAHQNDQTFEFEQDCLSASYAFKKLVALRMTQLSVQRFTEGQGPLSVEDMAQQLEIPVRLARDILHQLAEARILSLAQGPNEKENRYQPARDINAMTVQWVIHQMEQSGTQDIPVAESPEWEKLRRTLETFEQTLAALPENALLKDLSENSVSVKAAAGGPCLRVHE